jgi:hypothetical protein
MQLAQVACITNFPWICRIVFLLFGKCLQPADFLHCFCFLQTFHRCIKAGLDDCFEVSPLVVRNMLYLRDYYVAVIHIDCYKLYVQSCIHISLLIINADMIFSTRVFWRLYESINLYVVWSALPDSAMGMLQQFIRWYKPVSFVIWQASVGKQNGALQ